MSAFCRLVFLGDGQQRAINCQAWCKMSSKMRAVMIGNKVLLEVNQPQLALAALNSPAITIAAIKSLEYN
ncbi:MAG: hypothetical protein Q8K74_01480 [Candidatus Nitrotoga sp.]|nr:hypothetical protein [Candidatus Nitrotoga sp.]MDO9447814.1 hypothetical protein [Candidatus Nitrotoga sp.]MDP1637214.1 hypothetical protein [Candidatus Nitrotoga sp.]MDP1854710.1 hypothetical protein [Candidatus Nitrotoga sp.]MDP3498462.1 hypothetical protein [Candidatus Nitrotoga sp.]